MLFRSDIIYSVSVSGSGIYVPEISCFNFTNLTETKIYSSDNFEDFMLKKIDNLNFDIYIIDRSKLSSVQPDKFIFNPSTFSSNKKIGSISNKNGTPTMHSE